MAFKHYDVVRAASPSDLAKRLTQKLKEGWQPFGSPVAITPYTLMQAIAAEGDVTTPVVVKPSDGEGAVISTTSNPEYYFVVALAGQSNGMAYGEGLPLPETYDRPDPRIKQLARRSTVTPGGASCNYNDIIPAAQLSMDAWGRDYISRRNCCRLFRRMPVFFWFRAAVVVLHFWRAMKVPSANPPAQARPRHAGV